MAGKRVGGGGGARRVYRARTTAPKGRVWREGGVATLNMVGSRVEMRCHREKQDCPEDVILLLWRRVVMR